MANSIIGQLASFISSVGIATPNPFRTTGGDYIGRSGTRFFTVPGAFNGSSSVSGHTKVSGSPVKRRVLLFTQGPPTAFLYEVTSSWITGSFSFSNLSSGSYIVLDIGPDNSVQALVYDWVSA